MNCAKGMTDTDECLAQQTKCEVAQPIEDKHVDEMLPIEDKHEDEIGTDANDTDCAAEQADDIGLGDDDEKHSENSSKMKVNGHAQSNLCISDMRADTELETTRSNERDEIDADSAEPSDMHGSSSYEEQLNYSTSNREVERKHIEMKLKCTLCNLDKKHVVFSKTQMKKLMRGKGGKCRACTETRGILKPSKGVETSMEASYGNSTFAKTMKDEFAAKA